MNFISLVNESHKLKHCILYKIKLLLSHTVVWQKPIRSYASNSHTAVLLKSHTAEAKPYGRMSA